MFFKWYVVGLFDVLVMLLSFKLLNISLCVFLNHITKIIYGESGMSVFVR